MSDWHDKLPYSARVTLGLEPDPRDERIVELTAERDAAQREAEALRAALLYAMSKLHRMPHDGHSVWGWRNCHNPHCKEVAALLAPSPQPALESEAVPYVPQFSAYEQGRIALSSKKPGSELEGKQ